MMHKVLKSSQDAKPYVTAVFFTANIWDERKPNQ